MQRKRIVCSAAQVALLFLLSLSMDAYAAIAYMPQTLRNCISVAYESARRTNKVYNNLAELHAMIAENRIIASHSLVWRGLQEALAVVSNDRGVAKKTRESVESGLREALAGLENRFGVLALHGHENQRTLFPISIVTNSLPEVADDIDIMCLSSILSFDNVELWGNPQPHRLFDEHIFFNANAMTNVLHTTPNIIFGTGVTSPVINAWSMSPSTMIQSPINMQISVPGALLFERAETLDLHFLVKREEAGHGKARIAVNVKYMGQYDDFNIFSPVPTFSYEEQSNDFDIFEPLELHEVRHICVSIPLQKTSIKKCNFIVLSVTRIDPSHGVEYTEDIYLASAVLHYKQL